MTVPVITGEARLRLLSMQHNLLTKLDGISGAGLSRLVFLDVYGNQLERITGLESLNNLRVLLIGKNRYAPPPLIANKRTNRFGNIYIYILLKIYNILLYFVKSNFRFIPVESNELKVWKRYID